jgi:hypothetical protein
MTPECLRGDRIVVPHRMLPCVEHRTVGGLGQVRHNIVGSMEGDGRPHPIRHLLIKRRVDRRLPVLCDSNCSSLRNCSCNWAPSPSP